jgi:hypothetical protein
VRGLRISSRPRLRRLFPRETMWLRRRRSYGESDD